LLSAIFDLDIVWTPYLFQNYIKTIDLTNLLTISFVVLSL